MNSSSAPKRVLFVCVENSNRSQIAQAFARIHGGGQVEAYSAGSKPSGVINPRAIEAMRELGYDLSSQTSKSLDDLPTDKERDFVATMIVVAAARRGDDATAAVAQTATDAQAQALRYALDHELERASAVSEPRLLETLLHHANQRFCAVRRGRTALHAGHAPGV